MYNYSSLYHSLTISIKSFSHTFVVTMWCIYIFKKIYSRSVYESPFIKLENSLPSSLGTKNENHLKQFNPGHNLPPHISTNHFNIIL